MTFADALVYGFELALGFSVDSEHVYPMGSLEKRRRLDAAEAGGVLRVKKPASTGQAEREFRHKRRIMGAAETQFLFRSPTRASSQEAYETPAQPPPATVPIPEEEGRRRRRSTTTTRPTRTKAPTAATRFPSPRALRNTRWGGRQALGRGS